MDYGLKINKKYGKPVKGLLKRKKVYEDSYLPLQEANHIILPLRTKKINFSDEIRKYTSDYEINKFEFKTNKRTRSFRRELEKILPSNIFEKASRAYEQIGDIGIITVFPHMEKYEKEIAKALLETNKGIRLVLKKATKHKGGKRIQEYTALTGSGSTETTHSENNVKIKIDITKAYFSARTANERKRIASLINNEEKILVLFSGCAPYPLVISKNTKAKEIWGVESNQEAHKYALINQKLNNSNNIKLINGLVEKEIKNIEEKFDRIIIPHPTEADYYLSSALDVLKNKGIIHLYLFSKPEKLDYAKSKIQKIAKKKNYAVKKITTNEQLHISSEVKKYCFDIQLSK